MSIWGEAVKILPITAAVKAGRSFSPDTNKNIESTHLVIDNLDVGEGGLSDTPVLIVVLNEHEVIYRPCEELTYRNLVDPSFALLQHVRYVDHIVNPSLLVGDHEASTPIVCVTFQS